MFLKRSLFFSLSWITLIIPITNCRKFELNLPMPNVTVSGDDDYMCTGLQIKEDSIYFVGADPLPNLERAHHMNIFGCDAPGYIDPKNRL